MGKFDLRRAKETFTFRQYDEPDTSPSLDPFFTRLRRRSRTRSPPKNGEKLKEQEKSDNIVHELKKMIEHNAVGMTNGANLDQPNSSTSISLSVASNAKQPRLDAANLQLSDSFLDDIETDRLLAQIDMKAFSRPQRPSESSQSSVPLKRSATYSGEKSKSETSNVNMKGRNLSLKFEQMSDDSDDDSFWKEPSVLEFLKNL